MLQLRMRRARPGQVVLRGAYLVSGREEALGETSMR